MFAVTAKDCKPARVTYLPYSQTWPFTLELTEQNDEGAMLGS